MSKRHSIEMSTSSQDDFEAIMSEERNSRQRLQPVVAEQNSHPAERDKSDSVFTILSPAEIRRLTWAEHNVYTRLCTQEYEKNKTVQQNQNHPLRDLRVNPKNRRREFAAMQR
jgi:hypothetical protein